MLSIFGAYAEKQSGPSSKSQRPGSNPEQHELEEKLIPFYCRTLLDVSSLPPLPLLLLLESNPS
jgi:hypothetical protein